MAPNGKSIQEKDSTSIEDYLKIICSMTIWYAMEYSIVSLKLLRAE